VFNPFRLPRRIAPVQNLPKRPGGFNPPRLKSRDFEDETPGHTAPEEKVGEEDLGHDRDH